MKNFPLLYRKRIIPEETILLKNDRIVYMDNGMIITKWHALKPRRDFKYGFSCYYIEEGIKISKMFTADRQLVYTYCDIVDVLYIREENSYVFTDLLVDVVIYPDGFVKVLDLDEIPQAYNENRFSVDMVMESLTKTDKLLKKIYGGEPLTELMDKEIEKWCEVRYEKGQ